MIKVGINGFGRIGRFVFRAAVENRSDIQIVGINDLCPVDYLAYMLKYDTMHGQFSGTIDFCTEENVLIVNGQKIRVTAERNPADLKWNEVEAEYVVESTGLFLSKDKAQGHIDAGAKYVVMSAPSKDDTPMFVTGVNLDTYVKGTQFVSNASCTTNCIAPIMKVLEDNFGVKKAIMTTVHSYTGSQRLLDAPAKDLREARSAAENIVPTTTGASKAAALTIPTLKGKFNGLSIRVPTPVVSLADITAVLSRPTTKEELTQLFEKVASEPFYEGILGVSNEKLVSSDYRGDSHSCIVDLPLIDVVDGDLIKIVAWYDNEWGYSNRLVELTADFGKE